MDIIYISSEDESDESLLDMDISVSPECAEIQNDITQQKISYQSSTKITVCCTTFTIVPLYHIWPFGKYLKIPMTKTCISIHSETLQMEILYIQ